MRHFDYLSTGQRGRLFAVPPRRISREAPASVLALALGATLYSPGTRPDLAEDSRRAASIGTTSQVWDLEDAVPHEAVPTAQGNVVRALRDLGDRERVPLLFVRVRSPQQLLDVTAQAGEGARHLTGFVLPKFRGGAEGEAWLAALDAARTASGVRLYAMPVLEHEELAWKETRLEHLLQVRAVLDGARDRVLAARVGGTDLCGLFGLRRDVETTIWDVAVVRDMLADVVNVLGRRGAYPVSGPVWEHFASSDRLFRSRLRQTPFERRSEGLRAQLVRDDVDELIREVVLDRANGLSGKTVIHPTHVSVVNALQAVPVEEHEDALGVLSARETGGAVRSPSGTRMNEMGPHGLWAEQVVARAAVYGVLAEPDGVVALLDAGFRAAQRAYGPRTPDRVLTP